MLNEMKREIAAALDRLELKGDDAGGVKAVRRAVRDAVAAAVAKKETDQPSVTEIVREAVTSSTERLEKTRAANERYVAAAIQGVIDGTVSQEERDAIEKAWDELWVARVRLRRKREALADRMREALAGAQDSLDAFSGAARERLSAAIDETKWKHEEILGLTHENVSNAIKQVLQSGKDVELRVRQTAREATAKALSYTRLSAERVKRVTHSVLEAAVDGAKTGSRLDDVAREARQGTYEGVNQVMETAKETVTNAGERTTSYLKADLVQTQEDLKTLEKTLVEAARKAASSSAALIEQTRETAAKVKDGVADASGTVTERVTELGRTSLEKVAGVGRRTADMAADEIKELTGRTMAVTKGALSGIRKGASEAFHTQRSQTDTNAPSVSEKITEEHKETTAPDAKQAQSKESRP